MVHGLGSRLKIQLDIGDQKIVRTLRDNARTPIVALWLFIAFKAGIPCAQVVPQLLKHNEIRLCNSLTGKPDLIQTAPMLKAHFDA